MSRRYLSRVALVKLGVQLIDLGFRTFESFLLGGDLVNTPLASTDDPQMGS
jgi:hypothetical protein